MNGFTIRQKYEHSTTERNLIINATESQMERLANFLDDNDYVNTVDERAIAIHEEMNYLWSLETAEEFV